MAATTKIHSYAFTLTTQDGFTDLQVAQFSDWFSANADTACLTRELHKSGKIHLHACADLRKSSTNSVTRVFTNLYERLNIPCQKGVSIRIKKVTDRLGWFHYLAKDLAVGQSPVLCHGYLWGDIQEQLKLAVKKIPNKMVKGDDHTMNMVTAPNRVLEYAKSVGCPISGADSFAEVISLMAEDGYQMHNLKFKILYAQCMAKCGRRSIMRDLVLSELAFL